MSEEISKKRMATWDESKLEEGIISLVYDKSHGLEPIVIDLKDFCERAGGGCKWERTDLSFKKDVSNGAKQKVSDGVAAKGEKAGYTAAERHAIQKENAERVFKKLLWDKPSEGTGKGGLATYERAIRHLLDTGKQITEMAEKQPEPIKSAMLGTISELKYEDKTLVEWEVIKAEKLAAKASA